MGLSDKFPFQMMYSLLGSGLSLQNYWGEGGGEGERGRQASPPSRILHLGVNVSASVMIVTLVNLIARSLVMLEQT